MKLRKRRTKKSSGARKYFQVKRALIITKQSTTNRIQTSATSASRYSPANGHWTDTLEFTRVKSRMCALLVTNHLLINPVYEDTWPLTVMLDRINVVSAQKASKQKRYWTGTWNIILNLNFNVRNVRRSFTLLPT